MHVSPPLNDTFPFAPVLGGHADDCVNALQIYLCPHSSVIMAMPHGFIRLYILRMIKNYLSKDKNISL